MGPRFRELAPAARGGQEARSRLLSDLCKQERDRLAVVSAMNISREHLINIFSLLLTRVGVGKVLLLIPDADGAG